MGVEGGGSRVKGRGGRWGVKGGMGGRVKFGEE